MGLQIDFFIFLMHKKIMFEKFVFPDCVIFIFLIIFVLLDFSVTRV